MVLAGSYVRMFSVNMGFSKGIIPKKQLTLFIKLTSVCLFVLYLWSYVFYLWSIFNKCTYAVREERRLIETVQGLDIPLEDLYVADESRESEIPGISGSVDLVLTWVNGSDQSFIDDMSRLNLGNKTSTPKRFRDWGLLRYALRSVEKYANWFRHVYIVTNGQVPVWLNLKYNRVSIVKHSEIFRNKSHLPTFNSLAIECHIHRIPGVSKQFIYMNDDFFFVNNVELKDFYTKETGFKIRLDKVRIPDCSKKCKLSIINNGKCDKQCNISRCDWDGGDCIISSSKTRPSFDNLLSRWKIFIGSVVYTTLVFNKEFGNADRKVPAHVPYIIDKTLMNELQRRLPEEWDRTSAYKLRDPHCLLYAFAYYQYLMWLNRHHPGVTRDYPIATTVENYEDYSFLATGNSSGLDKALRGLLRNKKKKFACLNDHMLRGDKEEEARTQKVIDEFFNRLFPKPSKFEIY